MEDGAAATSKLYSGSVLVLAIVNLIESIAFTIPFSYFPSYADSLGASPASIGLFFSSFMLASTLLSPKLGGLSDRLGRRTIIAWGLFGDVVLGILTGLAPNWIWLLLMRILNGAAAAAATVPSEALLIDLISEKKRGEASGFVMAMFGLGMTAGPAFGGSIQWMASSSGFSILESYRIPYFADSMLAALALILVSFKLKEPKRMQETKDFHGYQNKEKVKTIISMPIKILLAASFASGFGVGFVMPVSVMFLEDRFGIVPIEIGLIISATGFIGIFAGWFAGRLSDKIGRKPMIAIGGLISRSFSFILPLSSYVSQAAIVLALRSLFFNIYNPALRALRADLVPEESRGRIFGLFSTAFNAGSIIGPLFGTWLYSIYFAIPYFVNAVFGITSVLFILKFVKKSAHVA